jgi:IS30 family transposase
VYARARMRGKHGVSAKGIAPTLGVHRTTVQRALLRDKKVDDYIFLKRRRQGMLKGTDVTRRFAFANKHSGGYMWRDEGGREHT